MFCGTILFFQHFDSKCFICFDLRELKNPADLLGRNKIVFDNLFNIVEIPAHDIGFSLYVHHC